MSSEAIMRKFRTYPCLMEHEGRPGMKAAYMGDGRPMPLPAYPGAPPPAFLAALHSHRVEIGSEEEAALLAEQASNP